MPSEKIAANVMNMTTLGDSLREARESRNLTFDQVQKQTHINSTVLKALEEGRCDSILNPTYVKSFLGKYSNFLGLDSGQMLAEYKRLHPESESRPAIKLPEAEKPGRDLSKIIILVKASATLLIAFAVVVFIASRAVMFFNKNRVRPVAAATAAKKARQPSVAAARAVAQKKAASKPAAGNKSKEISIPNNVPMKLLLKVNQPVYVKMRTDGNLIFERVLTKGTAEVFTADKVINIYTAKGEAIELILNGIALGSPGRGLIRNIEVTRSGFKIK
ncbi:MAG: helix-turn-helix domain-containing protein [Candidatus Omnitrophica bacterium]|nr:helix-turn-helix domain-containing protein [Candidatus Omnitrophota bacterium]